MTRKAILSLGTAVLTLGLLAGGEASAETYRLMTGPQGGVWVPLRSEEHTSELQSH